MQSPRNFEDGAYPGGLWVPEYRQSGDLENKLHLAMDVAQNPQKAIFPKFPLNFQIEQERTEPWKLYAAISKVSSLEAYFQGSELLCWPYKAL